VQIDTVNVCISRAETLAYEPLPLESGKAIIFFRANAKFFGQKPAAKNEKNIFSVFLKRKNRIHSVQRDKVPEIRDFY